MGIGGGAALDDYSPGGLLGGGDVGAAFEAPPSVGTDGAGEAGEVHQAAGEVGLGGIMSNLFVNLSLNPRIQLLA